MAVSAAVWVGVSAAAALSLSAIVAQAAQAGGQVVSGSGSISSAGATTTVNQSSPNLSLNWNKFNIASNETVNFIQPSASAIAVNRIFDTNGTHILGHLNANGQVYLINPNGILFGQGAQVNVGGLVASTLELNGSNGNTVSFGGTGSGSVINRGTITTANGGYVALLGNTVSNQGMITAQLGTVALGAGSAATLTFSGNSLVQMQVDRSTLNNLAENGGLIHADGGMVMMTAGAQDALLASVVNNTGVIEARTVDHQNGTITLLGGMAAGTVNVGGTLDASAPAALNPQGGNGGLIETSAAHVKIADGTNITTAAAQGLTGSWLIDPTDYTIAAAGGDITGAQLGTNLGSTNVTILSTAGASGTSGAGGNINVNDSVAWSAHELTLNAQNDIHINTAMNGSGTASLALQYGQGAVAAGNVATVNVHAPVNLPAGNNFSTTLGSDGATVNYTVLTSLGSAGSTTGTDLQGINGNRGGYYALGSNIHASATSIWNGTAGFTPIGTDAARFTGIFDGLGHTISSLRIRSSLDNAGLFGVNDSGGVIRNLIMTSASVSNSSRSNAGSVVGYNYGTISNVYTTSFSISTGRQAGGLVGSNQGAISTSAATGGSVAATFFRGGLVGNNLGTGSIRDSYSTTNISGYLEVGGLAGGNEGSATIDNSYATGSVYGSGYVGGLVGFYGGGTIRNSYWNTSANSGLNPTTGGVGAGSTTGATGLSSADMKLQASFTPQGSATGAWDFSKTWVQYDTNTYPLLRAFMTPLTVTANNAAKTYDGLAYSGGNGVTYSSTPNGNLLGTASYSGTSQGAVNVGSYAIAPGGRYSNQLGYIISYGNGTLEVNPATLTVSGTSAGNKVYDGTTTATLTGGSLLGLAAADAGTLTLTQSGTFVSKNIGTAIGVTANDSVSGASAGNYILAQPTGITADITPASLTYTATPSGMLAGQSPSGLTGTISGFVAGETLAGATSGAAIWSTIAHAASPAGNYAIDGSGLTAANYVFAQATGNATALTVQAAPNSPSSPNLPSPSPSILPPTVLNATTQLAAGMLLRHGRQLLDTSGSDAVVIDVESSGVKLPDDLISLNP